MFFELVKITFGLLVQAICKTDFLQRPDLWPAMQAKMDQLLLCTFDPLSRVYQ